MTDQGICGKKVFAEEKEKFEKCKSSPSRNQMTKMMTLALRIQEVALFVEAQEETERVPV